MILVLAGTTEGREIFSLCRARGYPVLATVATPYGKRVLLEETVPPAGAGETEIVCAPLGRREMAALILERGIRVVVDASHPFAVFASENARGACADTGAAYIRYARPPAPLPESPLLHACPGFAEAAEKAVTFGETIFLTTGSKTLPVFAEKAKRHGKRLVVRVLPAPEAVAACLALGLPAQDVIAMQGPFSYEVNRALFRFYGASVVVTKESGPAGGTAEKVAAALDLGIPVVLVKRPAEKSSPAAGSPDELLRLLEELL